MAGKRIIMVWEEGKGGGVEAVGKQQRAKWELALICQSIDNFKIK